MFQNLKWPNKKRDQRQKCKNNSNETSNNLERQLRHHNHEVILGLCYLSNLLLEYSSSSLIIESTRVLAFSGSI